MPKTTLPPTFKLKTAPKAVAVQKALKQGNFRGSAQSRGYDSAWNRLSIAFRKRHPFCLWCEQQGRDTLADLVDHIMPVVDRPDLRLVYKNLESLCVHHHGQKTAMEVYARENGLLDMLPVWCREPEKRPMQFRPLVLVCSPAE